MAHPDWLRDLQSTNPPDLDCEISVSPSNNDQLSRVLRYASESKVGVRLVGGGTRQHLGELADAPLLVSMDRFATVEAWEPDDLTAVVGAGIEIEILETMLAEKGQTAGLAERPRPGATIGGAVATAESGLRRLRMLGIRERILEVTVVTGDGRIVTGGGRVVKNVSGYDLPRLVVGSMGALGVITSVCIRLWPIPEAAGSIPVSSLDSARRISRPLAILQDRSGITANVWGTRAEVAALARRLDHDQVPPLTWPRDPVDEFVWSLRVPPSSTVNAIEKLPSGWDFLVLHGVGEVRASSDGLAGAAGLREWAESLGGRLVLVDHPQAGPSFDPWGAAPTGLEFQRRLIAQFDPNRIINRGRLPGGI